MHAQRMFLSFTSLTDGARHAEYNAWHQLDHLPENLTRPGVAWGDRWVRTPACAAVSHVPDPASQDHQYAVMYGFRDPVDDSVRAWTELNRRAIWWGRRPELGWTRRSPVGFFDAVKGYAADRTLVGPDAVLHRPHRGIHLTVSTITQPESPDSVDLLRAYDRDLVPSVLDVPGVAGAWTYRFAVPAAGFGDAGPDAESGLFVRMLYLDEDPITTAALLGDQVPQWIEGSPVHPGLEQVIFSSPLLSIQPWEWSWFDGET